MPELPEVEVVRRDLEREVVGKKVKAVDVDGMRTVRRHHNRKQFAQRLVGKKITGVERRGKYLLCKLDGDDVLVIHLGMSGQLLRAKTAREHDGEAHARRDHVHPGRAAAVRRPAHLRRDVRHRARQRRQAGRRSLRISASTRSRPRCRGSTSGACSRSATPSSSRCSWTRSSSPGIGNIYSDEILWGAGLRWDRMSDTLTAEEVRRLYRSMMETLQEAVKHRGSSLADEQYVDLFGKPGEYQHFHNVYAREGEACPRCRHVIVRERVSGRSTFYCAACQV